MYEMQGKRKGRSFVIQNTNLKTLLKEDTCSSCRGKGTQDKLSEESISVDPGTPDNHVLKFISKGHESPGSETGELHVKIRVQKHPIYTRKGADLEITKEISLKESLCGTKFFHVLIGV